MSAIEAVFDRAWAITPESLDTIKAIARRENPSPEEVEARMGQPLDNTHRATVRDGVATIPVRGPIFRYANLFTRLSGATSIDRLSTDFREAIDNPDVGAILLQIDSPGGEANGNGELANMIFDARGTKPIVAYVSGIGASAGYYLAAAADRVVVSPSSILGSIGTLIAFDRRGPDEREPLVVVAEQSPEKYHDPESAKGQARMQSLVNAMAEVFVADVAKFRGVSADHVLAHYGRGGIFVGQSAVAAGLADAVGSYEQVHAELASVASPPQRKKATAPVAASKPKGPAMSDENTDVQASELDRLRAQLAAVTQEKVAAIALADAAVTARIEAAAESFASAITSGDKAVATPAEAARAKADFVLLARDDHDRPVAGSPTARQDAIRAAYAGRSPHGLLVSRANSNPASRVAALKSDPADDVAAEDADDVAAREERRKANTRAAQQRNPASAKV